MTPTDPLADVVTDVAIVGAGPIGLELAAALKTACMPNVHLEGGPIGETITG